ncbi:acyltransferase [Streptomyces sp. BE303]|uniref:acyltransferase n=1 Tax=Streptomyces sp. BE303 TaxID=3002528 RepID=UPI002E7A4354|nr:acyltransferase [Streptomyces sp. BE303]MED7953846.1 acyltransferase [Streptomyces sp. BE303]
MSVWPQLSETRLVRAGSAPGTVLRCGLVDTMLADLSVSVVFFFERALDEDRLAAGLARALARIPVFAGRLHTVDGVLTAVCDDSGVPLESYRVDGTLAEAMGRVTLPGADLADPVDAPAARTGKGPLLTVRVTRTADGGTVLGCSWHHAIGDLQSFALLLRAWSAAVEGEELPVAELVEDQDALLDKVLPAEDSGSPGFRLPGPEESALLAREVAAGPRANRTVQLYFGDAEIARMREEFSAAAGLRVSGGDAVCAQVVHTVRQLDGDTETRTLTVPVNVRRPLGLPDSLLGNLLGDIHLPYAPADGPAVLAGALRSAVLGYADQHLNLRSNLRFLEELGRPRLQECVPLGFDPEHRRFSFSNWSRFGLYEVSFQGQRPVFFSPTANYPLPWVSWSVEGFHGTGLLTTVVLPARLAAKLRGDAGRAALHRFRDPADELPALLGAVPKVV